MQKSRAARIALLALICATPLAASRRAAQAFFDSYARTSEKFVSSESGFENSISVESKKSSKPFAYRRIFVQESSHPAVRSAAEIIAHKLNLSEIKTTREMLSPNEGEIVLIDASSASAQSQSFGRELRPVQHDGYAILFRNGGAIIYGARPRSLLYAAGDWRLWKDKTAGEFRREPDFAVRTGQYNDESRTVAEYVAELGVNAIIGRPNDAVVTLKETLPEVFNALSAEDQARLEKGKAERMKRNAEFARACRDVDVSFYAFLYGNDFTLWSPALYKAALKVYPSIRGAPAPASWEKAYLCPSDPLTWKLVRAYVEDFVTQTGADGIYATFWDRYGIYCQDERCQRDGLNKFPNELYECVKQLDAALRPLKKKLVVRTWSSGVPHWLRDEFVHAPGYGGFGGSGVDLWGRVIKELPSDIVIQTKVYNADCQPDPPFSPLLSRAAPHTEIAEYQISGQTVGRFYFPASSVAYNAWTMRKAHALVGVEGGVNVFPGGTHQSNYSLFDDALNSVNLYVWRELSWNVNADVDKLWTEWATPIYGERAAPHIVKALKLSEEAVNRTFSTLGMGSDTNSEFAGNIARRETLLMYTNRYYLPEYAKFLEPNEENIARVVAEKQANFQRIDEMFAELEQARPFLKPELYAELRTRFDWLKEYAICAAQLDESLWRYRYLRYLSAKRTTDPQQLKFIAQSYEAVKEHEKRLFQYDPSQKFSCYNTTLGQLRIKPSLGSPAPLMKELYEKSKQLIETFTGPDYLSNGDSK